MVFIGAYGAERVTTDRPPQQDGSMRGDTVYDAITDAYRLIVSIRASPCVDTMSGGRAYRGCGDALAP